MSIEQLLSEKPRRWLVTGSAGFIGSHLIETLLTHGQTVVSLDNFSTGHQSNLDEVRRLVGEEAWKRLGTDLPLDKLDSTVSEAGLSDLMALAPKILKGEVRDGSTIRVDEGDGALKLTPA